MSFLISFVFLFVFDLFHFLQKNSIYFFFLVDDDDDDENFNSKNTNEEGYARAPLSGRTRRSTVTGKQKKHE